MEHRSEPYKQSSLVVRRMQARIIVILGYTGPVKLILLSVRRFIVRLRLRLRSKIIASNLKSLRLDPDRVFFVSPNQIEYSSLKEFSILSLKGKVMGGDWDTLKKKFSDLDVFIAFIDVIKHGKNWETTEFYQQVLSKITSGSSLWGCISKQDLDVRCAKLSQLYYSIKQNGYKTQDELTEDNKIVPYTNDDEVIACIGRDGDLLFSDGAHRLAIAKILGLKQIPIKISVRHKKWIELRIQLLNYANKLKDKKLYQPILHPDLADIEAFHSCEDRFLAIKNNLGYTSGQLLDIGANLGFFCHKLEEIGFDCIAVEKDVETAYFLKKLKRANNKRFKILEESFLDSSYVQENEFKVILALNIFHHFLKDKNLYEKFTQFLKKLKVREIYFEPHNTDEEQMQEAYVNLSNQEFINLVLKNTSLKNVKCLLELDDNRKLYKLY